MKIQLLRLVAALLAGSIVMILHELPKAMIYKRINSSSGMKSKHNIYRLHHYIDPIGLILCVTNQAGFSKPYMYRIKDKKTNFILGITGFLSLSIIFMISMCLLKFGIGMDSNISYLETTGLLELFFQFTLIYIALISFTMFMVNLFPISTFDMGLCIAGKSPTKYFAIIRNDYFIKMLLVLVIMFGFITRVGIQIMSALL